MIQDTSNKQLNQKQEKSKVDHSYYYPSERENTCWGKGPFKARFPQITQFQSTSFCSKFCTFLCYFCCEKKVNIPEDQVQLQRLLPIKTPTFPSKQNLITYTWIGHSTAVISIGGLVNFIIDPQFSERCSPFQWIGPKRYRDPACTINKLPRIDAVLISHDHYDHLDEQSVNDLETLFKPIFFAGLDSKDSLPQGCRLQEMDWTETKQVILNGLKFQITFFPVCHWSKRKALQKNTRLWGGFIIKTPKGHKIFYPGDTGYCDIFKQIGELFGPFDLCIIPIGAYLPRFVMQPSHIDPEQAVIIHKELQSKKSVGVHWGTFPLGFQPYIQPKLDLQIAKKRYGLKENQFVTLQHGESVQIDYF